MSVPAASRTTLEETLELSESRFARANPRSRERHRRAVQKLPGGHTRQTLLYEPFPLTIVSGQGATLTDLDGHQYLDLVGEFGAGVYGHSCAPIRLALHETIDRGMSFGSVNNTEVELAELITSRIPSIEQVRFCNSGTEANLFTARLAQYVTKREVLLAFRGSYHGGFMIYGDVDPALNVPFDVVKCTYNDLVGTRDALRAHSDAIAAVIIEPMMGAGGCIPATCEFLQMLRKETTAIGALLIFDEVMTSRLGPNAAQGLFGVKPDLTTLGKFWGGGLNFGAFGGSRELMRHFDTRSGGSLSQAGTFNNNILTMVAGLIGGRDVYTPEACARLNQRGDELRERLNALGRRLEVPLQVTGIGAVMTFHWHNRTITNPANTEPAASLHRRLFQMEMMLAGFYVAQRGFTTLSLAMTDGDLDTFTDAVGAYLQNHQRLLSAD